MKKMNITVSYEEEKLNALKLYLEQKDTTIEEELTAAADSLYNKTVPTGVHEFISLRAGLPKPAEKKKKPRPQPAIQPVSERSESD